MSKKLTTEEFISRANQIHNNVYDYSKTLYDGEKKKIIIICKKHGEFLQAPKGHWRGYGCSKCSNNAKSNTEIFIDRCNIIHNNRYDYSLVEYVNAHTKVHIICPEHGKFSQVPVSHLYAKAGCPRCFGASSRSKNEWLNSLSVPKEFRQHTLRIKNERFLVDAYDPDTNTIYEFWGDYWHGNPAMFDPDSTNTTNGKSFKELYEETQRRRNIFLEEGYNLIEIWEAIFTLRTIINEIKEDIRMKISDESTARLKQLVRDGVQVLQECEDLKEGLSETVKAIAEELEVKPAIINRLIKDIQKNKMNDRRDDHEVLEELYKMAGLG